jgi:hypothetical protein
VGRRGDALKLYKLRKTDALRGVKLPTNMKHKGIRFKVVAQEAIDWYINHNRKDVRNFKSRMSFILKEFGDRVADQIKRPRSIPGLVHTSGPHQPFGYERGRSANGAGIGRTQDNCDDCQVRSPGTGAQSGSD